jgi:HemY protein
MAELERSESGDEGRAREWMARALHASRDPAWTADGFVSDRWMPVSPVSGRLDAFQWRVPLAEIGDQRETIEAGEPRPVVLDRPAEPPTDQAPPPAHSIERPAAPDRPSRRAVARGASRVEAVIPLVHVPDDPGPEPQPEAEPELPADARRRLR